MNVWECTVDDGEFKIEVKHKDAYVGQLIVFVVRTGEILLDEVVGLAYNAQFGPDVDDVIKWESKAIEVIDAYLEANK
jgi:hypothetical protein